MGRLTIRTHGSIADELVEEMGNPIDSVFVKKEMYKDCIHICDKNESCDDCPLYEVMRKLADYEDAEEQGLLLRLPFKIGQKVYYIYASAIDGTLMIGSMKYEYSCLDFPRVFYATFEEAEQALAEMQKG